MRKDDPITFLASFPAIQSAIKITGNGDGMRIQLDVPEIDILNALHLIAMRQQAFRVTITPETLTDLDDETEKGAEGSGSSLDRRRTTNRRDQRAGRKV